MPEELKELLKNSDSISEEDEKYFTDNYESMTEEQIWTLTDILENEQARIEWIEMKRQILRMIIL